MPPMDSTSCGVLWIDEFCALIRRLRAKYGIDTLPTGECSVDVESEVEDVKES